MTGNGVPFRHPHLYYYEKKGDLKEKGAIDLTTASQICPCYAVAESNVFSIATPGREFRLRAQSESELQEWVAELKSYQEDGFSKSPSSAILSEKPIRTSSTTEIKKTNIELADPIRPVSMAPFIKKEPLPMKKDEIIPEGSTQKVRQSIQEMRNRSLVEKAAPVVKKDTFEPTEDRWGSNEDSKELQTARKRLAKAQHLNSKYEDDIRSLRDTVSNLTRENQELKERLDVRENTVDFDKKRREVELEELKEKFISERKLRAELDEQFQDVRNELKVLKESIHIARMATPMEKSAKVEAEEEEPEKAAQLFPRLTPSSVHAATGITRTLKNVPRKISAGDIMRVEVNGVGEKKLWIKDEQINECMSCNAEFSLFTRKHHCRNCGLIFCNTCSNKLCPVPGYQDSQRTCFKCFTALRDIHLANKRGQAEVNPSPLIRSASTSVSSRDPHVTVLSL